MPRDIDKFIRFSGGSLFAGGVLAALVNAILTPLLPADGGSVAVVTSTAFGIRMPLAAVSIALVTVGCVGLYLVQADRLRLGAIAFLFAGIGGMIAFCLECVQFTLVRDLAFEAPETLEMLEESGRLARYDLGFAIGLATFALGWLAVAVVTLRAGVLDRRGPILLLLGMFLVPILGAAAGVWGAVAGNIVVGAGWALMGLDLSRTAERSA